MERIHATKRRMNAHDSELPEAGRKEEENK